MAIRRSLLSTSGQKTSPMEARRAARGARKKLKMRPRLWPLVTRATWWSVALKPFLAIAPPISNTASTPAERAQETRSRRRVVRARGSSARVPPEPAGPEPAEEVKGVGAAMAEANDHITAGGER